jgi:hypothetical protein
VKKCPLHQHACTLAVQPNALTAKQADMHGRPTGRHAWQYTKQPCGFLRISAAAAQPPQGRAAQQSNRTQRCPLAPPAHRIMCWECSAVALGAFNTAWHQCEPLHAEVALQPHVCWDTQRLRMCMLLSTLSRTSKQTSVRIPACNTQQQDCMCSAHGWPKKTLVPQRSCMPTHTTWVSATPGAPACTACDFHSERSSTMPPRNHVQLNAMWVCTHAADDSTQEWQLG